MVESLVAEFCKFAQKSGPDLGNAALGDVARFGDVFEAKAAQDVAIIEP